MNIIPMVTSLRLNSHKQEKILCEFILNFPSDIIHYSITEFSSKSKVSNASIVRFTQKLGFNGFHDFKMSLAQEIAQKDENDNSLIFGPFEKEDSIEIIAQKFYKINITALEHTMSIMNYNEVYKAAKMILSARKVHFFGIGYSGITALDSKYKFMRIGIDSDAYTDGHTMIMMSAIMQKDDLVFAISHSGNTREIVHSLKVAKECGAKIICISSSLNSEIVQFADAIAIYVSTESKFQSGSVSTKIAQFFVLDLIYTEVVKNSLYNANELKNRTTRVLKKLLE